MDADQKIAHKGTERLVKEDAADADLKKSSNNLNGVGYSNGIKRQRERGNLRIPSVRGDVVFSFFLSCTIDTVQQAQAGIPSKRDVAVAASN
jgi:hypothetical protein